MQAITIEFDWVKFADYRVETTLGNPEGTLLEQVSTSRLVGFGPPLLSQPLKNFPSLYLELVKADKSTKGHVAFARKYGLLTRTEREDTDSWPVLIENMKNLLSRIGNLGSWPIENGEYVSYELENTFSLRYGPAISEPNSFKLSVVPRNLYNALVLQCLASRAHGATIRCCKACGAPFEVGGSSGKRSHKEFCSDRCRFEFNHRDRKAKK